MNAQQLRKAAKLTTGKRGNVRVELLSSRTGFVRLIIYENNRASHYTIGPRGTVICRDSVLCKAKTRRRS